MSAGCAPRTASSLGPTPQELGDPTATSAASPNGCPFVREVEFPVITNARFFSSFGAPRDAGARWHTGVDIEAPAMTPVVAAGDGIVSTVHRDPAECCWVEITHGDGWVSMYLHLANDIPGGERNAWVGIRADLEEGDPIAAGEVLGWVGDSGNAEGGTPHLHFELRTPGGESIDPYPSLLRALERAPVALAATEHDPTGDGVIVTGRPQFGGPFLDDDTFPDVESTFTALLVAGALPFCDPWGLRICPDDPATGQTVTDWAAVLLDPLSPTGRPSSGECPWRCESPPVTWAEVASIVAGPDGEEPTGTTAFFEHGRSLGTCGLPNPTGVPTRREVATALLRLVGETRPVPCIAIR